MLVIIMLLILCASCLLSLALLPGLLGKVKNWQSKKEASVTLQYNNLFYDKSPKKMLRLGLFLPPVLGLSGYFIFGSLPACAAGVFLGLFAPNLYLRFEQAKRKFKFETQIIDMVMVISSCLKTGLSLTQALEVVAEEVPAPMSQEIGLMLRKNKMGVPLEECFNQLNKKMASEDLRMVISSLLVSRETGGNLTKVLSRLATTIRDNRKLKDNIKTLTLQGRMQAVIMSFLPFLFVWWVLTFNKTHFDIMLQSDTGRLLLIVAAVLQIAGMFLIKKFSVVRV